MNNIFKEKLDSDKILKIFSIFFIPVLSFFVLKFAFFSFSTAPFDAKSAIADTYIYVGYGYGYLDPSFFNGYYKISRLPIVLIQFIFRQLFNPEIVGYVLHFTMFCGSSFFSFEIAKRYFGKMAACLSSITLPLLMIYFSGGADYQNNIACFLFLFFIYFSVLQLEKNKDDSSVFFVLSGCYFSLVFHAHILISLGALICFANFYIIKRIENNKKIFAEVIKKSLFFAFGFILCTLALCLINYSIGRSFFFPKIILEFIFSPKLANQDKYWHPFSSFLYSSHYLSIFFANFIFSVFIASYLFIKKTHKNNVAVFVSSITFAIFFAHVIIMQFFKFNNLNVSFFAFTFLPAFAVLFPATLSFIIPHFKQRVDKTNMVIILVAVAIATFLAYLTLKYDVREMIIKANLENYSFFFVFIVHILIFSLGVIFCKNLKPFYFFIFLTLYFSFIFFNFTVSYRNIDNIKILNRDSTILMKTYIDGSIQAKKYRQDYDKNRNGNIFVFNEDSGININVYLQKKFLIQGLFAGYPLDDATKKVNMNKTIDDLWRLGDGESADSNWFKYYFLNYNNAPRVIFLFSNDEASVKKMINKMKAYNINFVLSEKRRIFYDSYLLQYFVLTEDSFEKKLKDHFR